LRFIPVGERGEGRHLACARSPHKDEMYRSSGSSVAQKHDRDGHDDKFEILAQRLLMEVIDVHLDHLLESDPAPSIDLPWTG